MAFAVFQIEIGYPSHIISNKTKDALTLIVQIPKLSENWAENKFLKYQSFLKYVYY